MTHLCAAFDVSASGYFRCRGAKASHREAQDAALKTQIPELFYGTPVARPTVLQPSTTTLQPCFCGSGRHGCLSDFYSIKLGVDYSQIYI